MSADGGLTIVGSSASSGSRRTATVLIQKPGYRRPALASLGSADEIGGAVGDVTLTALSGFQVAANPLTAPVPDQ